FGLWATCLQGQIHPIPGPNWRATWVKQNDATGNAASNPVATTAFANPLHNPSIIIVWAWGSSAADIATPTDTAGNTYVDSGAGPVTSRAGFGFGRMFYALNTHTTSSNVVQVANGGLGAIFVTALEFSGAAASPVRATSTNSNANTGAGGGQNITTGAIAGTVNGDLIVGGYVGNQVSG